MKWLAFGSSRRTMSMNVALIVPFMAWNWSMGFMTFQHHTHPTVPWYADEREWSFYAGQVRSVVHIEFPRLVDRLLHNIMDHTAHHVDPRIALYNLPDAQRRLEQVFGSDITVVPWTLMGFLRTMRTCKLFDYERHRWLDFDGQPTTASLLRVGGATK